MKQKNYPLRILLIFILSLFLGVCSSQIATFPHTTDFELGIGPDWINPVGDDFDWSHRSGASTPSGGTGPQSAPYGALGTNGYMYIESSTPNYPSKQAWLDGRCDFTTNASPQLTVNYHMYASNGVNYGPGLLQLDVYDGSTWTYDIWNNTSGDINWQSATIDLSAYAGLSYVILSWTGYTVGWQSDICLDELLIEDGNPSAPFVVDTYPYEEGFDLEPNASTACCTDVSLISTGWSNGSGDDCDWKPRDVNTPSLNTGPSEDESGSGSYLYMEASGCYSKTAYLLSPKFDFTQETSPFIQFYYHMYGSTVSLMTLEWSLDQAQWFPAWSQSGDQGNAWQLGFADLPILKGAEVYFRITGTTGSNYESDMGFDGFQGFGGGQPLPVDLVSFSGELNPSESAVVLNWVIASQVNNDFFEIERSVDIEEWETIDIIEGAGTVNVEMTYNTLDYNPVTGVSYYRLKQTDHNGDYKTFNPIAITLQAPPPHILNKLINTMGQEVDDSYNGLIIEIWQDGTSTKRYKLNKQ